MSETKRTAGLAAALTLLLGLAAGGVYWFKHRQPAAVTAVATGAAESPASPAPDTPPEPPAPETPPAPQHPVPAEAATSPPAPPLPALADSDPAVGDALKTLFGFEAVAKHLIAERLAHRLVVTVDSLTGDRLPLQDRLVKRLIGDFAVTTDPGSLPVRGAANDARYAPVVAMFTQADPAQVARLYVRYYPLFERAYHDLGYPEAHFNDRAVQVIDHLLQTPDLPDALALSQPRVFQQYADPALEARSSGQRLLLRLGRAHRLAVLQQLRAIRSQIARRTPG